MKFLKRLFGSQDERRKEGDAEHRYDRDAELWRDKHRENSNA